MINKHIEVLEMLENEYHLHSSITETIEYCRTLIIKDSILSKNNNSFEEELYKIMLLGTSEP